MRYNGGRSLLAPFTLFSRRGERYLRAITLARDGRQASRLKLGTFKLSGLSEVEATDVDFSPGRLFRATAPAGEERR